MKPIKKSGQKSAKNDNAAETSSPAPQRAKKAGGSAEFRSDEWEKIYLRRIDDTIAALKSKGVPVIWVGLPSIRGARSSGDAAYLNELYRARAERAGITYIDVWDGFVDEAGKYSNYGPDYEGQVRRLRSSDGVFFTKAGAIKLARYVEHSLGRYMSNRVPVALPSGPVEPAPSEAKPAERPLMGPVVPLTRKDAGDVERLRRTAWSSRQQPHPWRRSRGESPGEWRDNDRAGRARRQFCMASRRQPSPVRAGRASRTCGGRTERVAGQREERLGLGTP